MKYFVAPTKEQTGKGELDFNWADPGEPVVIGSATARAPPAAAVVVAPSAGCGRARAPPWRSWPRRI
ncbi:MAG: hypothetical protein Q8K86_05995 [Candidatus Nanopelagicaceae bacterium]|nr:hypothetical protein [Candidatus Nanopelagicaceae bacterium]